MASKSVMDAFAARIAANWTHSPIVGPNTTGQVTDGGTEFLVYEFPVAEEEQISLGAPGTRVFREWGSARIALCVPIGNGTDPFQVWIETLRGLFRGVQFGTATSTTSMVSTWAPGPTTIHDRSDRGAYFEISFAIPYYFDFLG